MAENVDGYGRCKASSTSRLLGRPLDVSLLARVCAPGGLLNTPANPDAAGLANLRLGSGTLDGDCHSPSGPRAPAAARGGPVGASPARRRRSIEIPDPAAASMAVPSPTGRGPAARRRSMEMLDPVAMAAMEALGSGGSFTGPAGEGAAPAARARRASLLLGDGSSGKAGKGAAPAAPVRFNSWKEALSHLLQVGAGGWGAALEGPIPSHGQSALCSWVSGPEGQLCSVPRCNPRCCSDRCRAMEVVRYTHSQT